MKLSKNLKLALRALLLKCGEISTDNGRLIYDAEVLEVGTEVFIENVDEAGNVEYVAAPDGEYKAEGKIYVVAEGKIAEIKDEEAPAEETAEAAAEEMAEDPNEPAASDIEKPEEEAISVEDRLAALENRFAEFTDGIEKVINAMAALEERLAAVENKLAEVEKPAADPIDETVEESEQPKSKLGYLKRK